MGSLKDEEIEDSIYSLPVNGFTDPIKSEVGWAIFIIKNKISTPFDLGNQQVIDNMKKVIRNRRIEKRYKEYLNELLSGITININPESFKLVYSEIWKILKTKHSLNDSTNYFELSEFDFNKINLLLLDLIILTNNSFLYKEKQISIERLSKQFIF